MADIIDYRIIGDDLQLVEIELDPGEGVRAEAGAMTYMEADITMDTNTAGGGLLGGFKRMLVGESFFITTFMNQGHKKSCVGFSAPYPGKIIPIDLSIYRDGFICQKDSYLCSAKGVNIEVAFTKRLGAGFFGGEGFILQRLSGDGMSFIHAGGTIIEKKLLPGEVLKIDTGCIVGFEPSVQYDIQFIGGFKNVMFGREGLFLATLSGPGTVYIQSLPISKLAERIGAAIGSGREQGGGFGNGAGAILAGGVIGSLFGSDE